MFGLYLSVSYPPNMLEYISSRVQSHCKKSLCENSLLQLNLYNLMIEEGEKKSREEKQKNNALNGPVNGRICFLVARTATIMSSM